MAEPKLVSSTEFKIEKGVPVIGWAGGAKYPWADMEVGDSFFVTDLKSQRSVRRGASLNNKNGKRFMTRAVDGGVRVWRTA